MSTSFRAGGVVASLIVAALIAAIFCALRQKKTRRRDDKPTKLFDERAKLARSELCRLSGRLRSGDGRPDSLAGGNKRAGEAQNSRSARLR